MCNTTNPRNLSFTIYRYVTLELCRINADHLGAGWKTASFSLASRAPATHSAKV